MSIDPYRRRVKNAMSRVVITADVDDTVRDALTLMEENRISALPVVDRQRRCVGILTATDLIELTRELDDELTDLTHVSDVSRQWLLEALAKHELGQQKLGDRMTAAVEGIGAEATLHAAASEMLRDRIHHLPVLDDQKRLLGILSTMDVRNAFVEGGDG